MSEAAQYLRVQLTTGLVEAEDPLAVDLYGNDAAGALAKVPAGRIRDASVAASEIAAVPAGAAAGAAAAVTAAAPLVAEAQQARDSARTAAIAAAGAVSGAAITALTLADLQAVTLDPVSGDPIAEGRSGKVYDDPDHAWSAPLNGDYLFRRGGWAYLAPTSADLAARQAETDRRLTTRRSQASGLAVIDRRGRSSVETDTDGALRAVKLRVGRRGASANARAVLRDDLVQWGDGRGRVVAAIGGDRIGVGGFWLRKRAAGGAEIVTAKGEALAEFAGPSEIRVAGVRLRGGSIPGVPLALLDPRGRVYSLLPPASGSTPETPDEPVERFGYRYQLNHVIALGQSWMGGTNGVPPISTTPVDGILMFSGGIRPRDDSSTPATIYADLIPAIEETNPAGVRGETMLSGAARQFQAMALADGETAETTRLLVSAVAPGGSTLANISRGSSSYIEVLAQVAAGYARAQERGWTYRVAGIPLAIGKGDYDLGEVDRALFKSAFLSMQRNLDADIRAIVPGHPTVRLFGYQTLSHTHDARVPNIDLALLDAAAESADIIVVQPFYAYPRAAGDTVHYPAQSYRDMGIIGGAAIHRTAIAGNSYQPLLPVDWVRQGRVASLVFDPVGSLVLDTVTVTNPGNYGFSLAAADGSPLTVSSVALAGRRLDITAAAPIPAGAKVRAAWTGTGTGIGPVDGPRTCLRDSQGDTITLAGYAAHRWCPLFEITLT